jgi:hypothetical protein
VSIPGRSTGRLSLPVTSLSATSGSGPRNALGRVKFMLPNPHHVYLHDTPARELFAKTERAFSSGCIHLEAYGAGRISVKR